nr:choline-phosphate cytidylyltransferase 2 [Ipomoea batatas]GMD04570.1 choline-phosphate cytidylyltransferase 2 [Ipomoea batatas]
MGESLGVRSEAEQHEPPRTDASNTCSSIPHIPPPTDRPVRVFADGIYEL